MTVTVHRGTGQIGGNLIEISTENTRLLFDAGANLPPLDQPQSRDDFELEGLTCGEPAFDWVFISHHHHDHCGLVGRILPGIPIFAGEETTRILNIIADFTRPPRPPIHFGFRSGQPIQLDDIRVTPIGVDHSARDAYMFLVQADGKSVLYTGDYRQAGHVPDQVQALLGEGKRLDLLISEGTNIREFGRGPRTTLRNERTIEEAAVPLMEQYDGTVFVLASSANEERVQSIRRAAQRSGRKVCEDLFQTTLRNQPGEGFQRFVANKVTQKGSPRAFPYFRRLLQQRALVGARSLARIPGKKVIFVRTSMQKFMKTYLKNRPAGEKNLLIYSMWQGYKSTSRMQEFFTFCEGKRLDIVDLHCSGHAGYSAIRELIRSLSPAALLPIHCEEADRSIFTKLHPNCPMAVDGQRIQV